MKAELDEKGVLVISAETPVEGFALTHWQNLWEKQQAFLLVTTIERSPGGAYLNTNLTPVRAAP